MCNEYYRNVIENQKMSSKRSILTNVIQVCLLDFFNQLACDNAYGLGCREPCGNCLDLKPCDHTNGSCINGCAAGFKGDTCKEGDVLNCFHFNWF